MYYSLHEKLTGCSNMTGEIGGVSLRALRRAWVLSAVALLAGCSSDDDDDGTNACPGTPSPAFAVNITAAEGPLPQDTAVRLAYGGGDEEYSLAGNGGQPSVMFCTPERASAGAGGEGGASAGALLHVVRLVCEVWIEGSATIWISGGDYPEIEAELKGESNECGPETVEEDLVLGTMEPETKP